MESTPKPQASAERLLYNIKILRNFVAYLRERLGWSQAQLEDLFLLCGTHFSFIDSEDNWFDQDLADRFYYAVVRLTGDYDIAYKVGAYTLTEFSRGIGGRIIQGSFSPALTFRNIQRIARAYTRGSHYEPILILKGRAIIRSVLEEGCEERGYQCRNRQGMVESIIPFFGCTDLKSEHKVCIHLGGPYCEYELHWKEPLRTRPIPGAIGIGAIASVLALLGTGDLAWALGISLSSALFSYLVLNEIIMSRLKTTLADQNKALEESVRIMTRRRDEQVLLRDIMRTTIEMRPIPELCSMAVNLIRNKMHYDRAVLLLVDEESNRLKVAAAAGFPPEAMQLIENAEFNIRADNNSGFLIRVVNTRESLLLIDVQNNLSQLSDRSQKLLQALGTQAFIAVPMNFKERVLGVLSVENTSSSKPLDTNDRDLMASLGDHLAVAVSNARNFTATAEALRTTRELEQEQREARELFQKYVPSEVSNETGLKSRTPIFLRNQRLSVLFCDIIGFTTLAEKRPTDEVAAILSTYIELINEVVIAKGARINKVIGDGLLVYCDPTQVRILDVGYAILQNLVRINSRLAEKGFPSIQIALGAHRGVCTYGSIGYERRLDYTLIGDAVNTASRIQAATRPWGVNLFAFSPALLDEAEGFEYETRGHITLKGRQDPLEILVMKGISTASLKQAA